MSDKAGANPKKAQRKTKRTQAEMTQMTTETSIGTFENDVSFKSTVKMSKVSSLQGEIAQMNGFTYTCDQKGNIIQKTIING